MEYKSIFSRYSVIALCALALSSCATNKQEGVKYGPFETRVWYDTEDIDAVNRNAKVIYDIAQKGYALSGFLFVNRMDGRKYSETVDSQAKQEAKKMGIDLITQSSGEITKTTRDVSEGLEHRTRVQGFELIREHRAAPVWSGDTYSYRSTQYLAWKYNPAMAYATLMPAAAALGYNDVLKQYVKKGVSPFTSFSEQIDFSPPALAIKGHHPDTLRLLLSYGGVTPKRMDGLMELAIKAGDLPSVKILFSKKLEMSRGQYAKNPKEIYNERDESEYTPLMRAAYAGQKDIVVYLLQQGADPKLGRVTYYGYQGPTYMAEVGRHPEIVAILKAAICRAAPKDASCTK